MCQNCTCETKKDVKSVRVLPLTEEEVNRLRTASVKKSAYTDLMVNLQGKAPAGIEEKFLEAHKEFSEVSEGIIKSYAPEINMNLISWNCDFESRELMIEQ